MQKLSKNFYHREDVITISKELLGKILITNFNKNLTSGMIVETEAYAGLTDKASHAYNGKRTPRTKTMYESGGVAYVYLCYGIHHLFNIVTNVKNIPHAVLIRAIQPQKGLNIMLNRRAKTKKTFSLTAGPGSLSKALGISIKKSGISLLSNHIWVEDQNISLKNRDIIASPRVGVQFAEEDAKNHWRFRIKNNPWVSPAN